jgi:hypothetical protein
MLSGIEKGRDFLSRVDEVVEVQHLDSVDTQQELILVDLWRRYGKPRNPPAVRVSDAAIWLLSWVRTDANFRAISKIFKTIPPNADAVGYRQLNLSSDTRRDFEDAVMEVGRVVMKRLQQVLSEEMRFGITLAAESKGDVLSLTRESQSLLDALQLPPPPTPRNGSKHRSSASRDSRQPTKSRNAPTRPKTSRR